MKKQGLKIRAALFLVTAALASSPVLTSVAAATKKDVSSAKDKKSALAKHAVPPPSISIKAALNRTPIADIGAIPNKDAPNAPQSEQESFKSKPKLKL